MWKIKKSMLQDLLDSAKNYYPNEFLCFLGGNKNEQIIEEFIFFPSISGKTFASINTLAIPFDETIIGTVHSHPSGSTTPSEQDKKLFLRYKINIIIGTRQEKFSFYNNQGEIQNVEII